MRRRLAAAQDRRMKMMEWFRRLRFRFVSAAVWAGRGIGAMPTFMVTQELAAGRLVRVDLIAAGGARKRRCPSVRWSLSIPRW